MKVLRISGMRLALDEPEEQLRKKAASILAVAESAILKLEILKKAVDARRNKPPHLIYVVQVKVAGEFNFPCLIPAGIQIRDIDNDDESTINISCAINPEIPVVVIGSGPAGLFAAYMLTRQGFSVILLERGTPIEKRTKDVRAFWEQGVLNSSSNVLFGEGGAGTFSDGKLTYRSKSPHALWVKKILVEMGAPVAILTDAKPHIGTDQLRKVIINLRNKLVSMGCNIRFEAQVTDFITWGDVLHSILVNDREEIKTQHLILAIGQNADDTYRKLAARGVKMEAKPFALGLRVEHPQELINSIQYGKWSGHHQLPPAEYFLTAAFPGVNRSVYTFCMCPGGAVIGCSAFPGHVLTNGMSNSRRDGKFANSAVIVNVRVEDFACRGDHLAGLDFRAGWERKAFAAGGEKYYAPAQRLVDFLGNKKTNNIGPTSFRPGVQAALLQNLLPPFAVDALRCGIDEFDKKMPGFITEEANLIGVETRTSAPVRICRKSNGQSDAIRGIYPCGEGAGYAGGIISSALDGIKAAGCLINNLT